MMLRTALFILTLLVLTVVLGSLVLVAQLLGVPRGRGSVYERAPLWWAKTLLRVGKVKVIAHRDNELPAGVPRVYLANHMSWFDILCMIDVLPQYGFVAKRELERIPLFGPAARAVGVIFIDRENRKAAFGAYEDAAAKIREGQSVIVYPEATRGITYPLRQFKKGPFVLAIQSGAPIVPVAIYGTREINPRGSFMMQPGTVHVHLLDPVPTAGLTYADRDQLAAQVRDRIAATLRETYGVDGEPVEIPGGRARRVEQQQATADLVVGRVDSSSPPFPHR